MALDYRDEDWVKALQKENAQLREWHESDKEIIKDWQEHSQRSKKEILKLEEQLAETKILQDELHGYGYEITDEMDGFAIACTSCGFPKSEGHADDCDHDLEYSNAECLQRSMLLIEAVGIIKAYGDSSIPASDMMAAVSEWQEKCRERNIA